MQAETKRARRPDLLFRVDAGDAAGFGHLRRCQALAAQLRHHGLCSAFLVPEGDRGREWLVSRGEMTRVLGREVDEAVLVVREALRAGAWVVGLDLERPIGRHYVMTLRRAGRAVVLLGNDGPGRLVAHLSVSAAAPPDQSWRGALGEHVASPSYAILGEPFRPRPKSVADEPTVLVTMGGNDPDGSTLMALAALESIESPMRRVVVVGPGFARHADLQAALTRARYRYDVHYNVPEMAPLVSAADVAVASFGISAYELAAAGVAAVLVLRHQRDRWHADRFTAAGAAVIAEPNAASIAAALRPLVAVPGLRRQVGLAAERLVDGRGTERVAEMVLTLAHECRVLPAQRRSRRAALSIVER
jgi:spore coat polysaccharide biosynthesis protein SpsF